LIGRKSLRFRIVMPTIFLFILLTAALITVIRFSANRTIETFIHDDIDAKQSDMYQGMTMVMDELNLFYSRIVLSDAFQNLIADGDLDDEARREHFLSVMDQVGMNEALFTDVLFKYDTRQVRTAQEDTFGPIPHAFVQRTFESQRLIEFFGVVDDTSGRPHLLFSKRLSPAFGEVEAGGLFFYVDEQVFRSFYDTIDAELGHTFILAADNTVISNIAGDHVGDRIYDAGLFTFDTLPGHTVQEIDGEAMLIIVNDSRTFTNRYHLEWRVVSVLSHDKLYASVVQMDRLNLLLGIAMAFTAFFLSLRVAKRITRPVRSIITRLRTFTKTGTPPEKQGRAESDELVELENTYDEMIEKILELIDTNKKKAEAQRKLELYTLQMQINPHFLYNTLDTIGWQAKLKNQPEIEQLVLALAKFFRLSLHKGDKYINVEEEIELIGHFLEIELIRFPDKFTVTTNIDENIRKEKMLKLLLQPIVENAIKHGIAELDRKGHITINAIDEGTDIRFEVIDDGIGFEPGAQHFKKADLDTMRGYGLKNVDDRIKLEYGPTYGIVVDSKPKGGTKVTLRIKKDS